MSFKVIALAMGLGFVVAIWMSGLILLILEHMTIDFYEADTYLVFMFNWMIATTIMLHDHF